MIFNGFDTKKEVILSYQLNSRDQLLNVIHKSHLGICKTLECARTSISGLISPMILKSCFLNAEHVHSIKTNNPMNQLFQN